MRVLLFPIGSAGDVYPMIGLGAELRRRGHEVHLITSAAFAAAALAESLVFHPIGSEDEFHRLLRNPDLWHPRRGFATVVRIGVLPHIRPLYDLCRDLYLPGNTVAVTSMLGLGVRLAQERLGLPVLTLHLQPIALRSNVALPPGLARVPPWMWLRRTLWSLVDRWIDSHLRSPLNRHRADLGLSPLRHPGRWWDSPLRVVGMWPDWFASAQPDWPPHASLTDFPLYDAALSQPMPDDLARFLDADPSPDHAPIVFSFGSAMVFAHHQFAAALGACRSLGRRGVFLTQYPEQLPSPLPDIIHHARYAPFSAVLPRASAFVHHGGIGTCSQALAAAVPQLVTPLSHDQPDNALRLQRLGVGDVLATSKCDARRLAAALDRLIGDADVRRRAGDCAARMTDRSAGIRKTADAVESLTTAPTHNEPPP